MAKRPDKSRPSFIVGDSIADILAEAGISLGRSRLSPGRDAKVICPACQGGRTKEPSLSVKQDADGAGATWHCFRGSCPGSASVPGNGRIESAERPRGDNVPQRRTRMPVAAPVLHSEAEKGRPDSLYGMFEKRAISRETVDAFGIYGLLRRWPQLDADGKEEKDEEGERIWVGKPSIVFPYVWQGRVVNRKFRSIHKQFGQDKDALRTLYNADAIESPDEVVICEGEFDVLACYEAGLRQVVSLPDGSPNKLLDEDDPKRLDDLRFDALETCVDVLADVTRIVIATDDDVAGGYLAEEFARRFGRSRCFRVQYPKGCKDANEVLMQHGPEAVRRCIEQAEPWPLAGLFNLKRGALQEFLSSGSAPQGYLSGIAAMDKIARLPIGGGWLTLLTGIPSHGKGAWLSGVLTYVAMKNDIGIIWCSPEDNRPEISALRVAEVIKGAPAREAGTFMPPEMLEEAEEWIRRRITYIYSDDPDTEMTLDWVLARAEEAKRRHKRHLLVLDPWNEFEHQYGARETEVQYVNRWLRRIKAWGRAEGLGILIAAHPKQQVKDPKTGLYPVVEGYDINGGAPWFNKADLGLTVYRREEGQQEVLCWKARYPGFGERYGKTTLKLDRRTGRLSSIAAEIPMPPPVEYAPDEP